jgi:hypothetical protein
MGRGERRAGRVVPLDFGKQPHRENHEKAKERDDVLDAIVPKHMLKIKRNGRHQNDHQRKTKLDFYRHCNLPNKFTTGLPRMVPQSWPAQRALQSERRPE